MAGLLKIIIDHHRKNRQRDENFKFFKACMAAAALTAISDGHACRREDAALKAMIRMLRQLKLYGTSHGTEIYDKFVDAIDADPEGGSEAAMAAIAAVRDEPKWAALLVAICATVSEADGVVVEQEVESIKRISSMLGVDPNIVRAFKVDTGNELHE